MNRAVRALRFLGLRTFRSSPHPGLLPFTFSPLPVGERVRVRGVKGWAWALVFFLAGAAQAMPLGLESGPYLFRTYPPAISSFIQLTNQAILYGNQTFAGTILPIPLMSGGVGVRLAETLGQPFGLGVGFSLFGMETGTSGAWGPRNVSISLGLSYADLHVLFSFSPLPGLLFLGLSGGLGWASLSYACEFPDLPLSFVPDSGEWAFSGRAFVVAVFLRAAWPIFSNLTAGVEGGFRWAFFPTLLSGDTAMDLNRDGRPDSLDLSGFWLGVSLRVEFVL